MSDSRMTLPRSQIAIMAHVPQLPGEDDDAYLALIAWVQHLAPKPSALERLTGIDAEDIRAWKSRYDWDGRLARSPYVTDGSIVADRLRVDSVVEMVERMTRGMDASDVAQALAMRSLQLQLADHVRGAVLPPTPDQTATLAQAAKALAEVERLKRGQSTSRVDVQQTVRLDRDALAEMSAEELDVLERALPAVIAGGSDDGSEG